MSPPPSSLSLPSPPFVPISGIANFRDIGGYPISKTPGPTPTPTPASGEKTPPSKSVRRNFLFRSAEPSKVTSTGIQQLKSLGIRTIFDLRSAAELEKLKASTPVVEMEGIERVFAPVFAERDYSPEKIALRYMNYATTTGNGGGFTKAYRDILDSAPQSYRQVLLHVRDRPGEPCVIHCTAGKDRTGVLAALLLELAGVDERTIAEEYELTEVGLARWKPLIIEHLLKEPALAGNEEGVRNMVGAKAANMLATLAMVNEKYGGAEGYFKEKCGFSDQDVQKIRAHIMAEDPS